MPVIQLVIDTKTVKPSFVSKLDRPLLTQTLRNDTLGNTLFPRHVLSFGIIEALVMKSWLDRKQQAVPAHIFDTSGVWLIISFWCARIIGFGVHKINVMAWLKWQILCNVILITEASHRGRRKKKVCFMTNMTGIKVWKKTKLISQKSRNWSKCLINGCRVFQKAGAGPVPAFLTLASLHSC